MANAPRTQHQHLVTVDLGDVRPTQITVGYAEVESKRTHWAALTRKQRDALLTSHWFPTVLGPGGAHYIVDHHHLGLALWREGARKGYALVLRDLSFLPVPTFWEVMEFHQWAHPYDARGKRCAIDAIPQRLKDLHDDPYRSLAGLVRCAGGFAKDTTPFAEFLWAGYFRDRVPKRDIEKSRDAAVARGVELARVPEARYLPGWTGEHTASEHPHIATKA